MIEIPVPAFAIAAYEAARIHNEDPADVFNEDKRSRARIVAITAIQRMFPSAETREVMKCFGWDAHANRCINARASAMTCGWWSEEDVDTVIAAVRKAIRSPGEVAEPTVHLRPRPSADGRTGERGLVARAVYRPPRGPSNVTAYLMGDPGAGQMTARLMGNDRTTGNVW